MVRQITQKVVIERSQIKSSETIDSNEETEQPHMFIFPYKVKLGNHALRNINRETSRHLPENKKGLSNLHWYQA